MKKNSMDYIENKLSFISDIIITSISIEYVLDNTDEFNTNNHRIILNNEELITSDIYEETMTKTSFKNWADLIDLEYKEIELSLQECIIIQNAGKSGQLTNRVPNQFLDELKEISNKIKHLLIYKPCFARFNRCSLKNGINGPGPFITGLDIISNIVTSYRCLDEINRNINFGNIPTILYIIPWDFDMNIENEFRIFVHNHRITAISQYYIYKYCGWNENIEDMKIMAKLVNEKLQVLLNKDETKQLPFNFTMDVLYNKGYNNVKIIELNSFGLQMAAGSCLFNWITDYDQLYGKNQNIEIRIVSE